MWELDFEESWTPRNWCFSTVVLKTLESPLDSRRSNQSILKEISPECSLEGLMLGLKLQYFGPLMRRVDSLEKTLMLGGIGGRRRRGRQRKRWLDGITDLMDMSLGEPPGVGDGQGGLACCDSWGHKESDMTEWLNWTELSVYMSIPISQTHPTLPLFLWCPYVCSLCLRFYFCFANNFIWTIFLDSTCMC